MLDTTNKINIKELITVRDNFQKRYKALFFENIKKKFGLTDTKISEVLQKRRALAQNENVLMSMINADIMSYQDGYNLVIKTLIDIKNQNPQNIVFALVDYDIENILENDIKSLPLIKDFPNIVKHKDIIAYAKQKNNMLMKRFKVFPDNFIFVESMSETNTECDIILSYNYIKQLKSDFLLHSIDISTELLDSYILNIGDNKNVLIDNLLSSVSTKEIEEDRIINNIIEGALKNNASDIHIVPSNSSAGVVYNVFYRINGFMAQQGQLTMSGATGDSVIRVLKNETAHYTFGDFNPDDKLRAQSGRILKDTSSGPVDIRIEFCPDGQVNNEDVTLRLIRKSVLRYNTIDRAIGEQICLNFKNPLNIVNEDFSVLSNIFQNTGNGLIVISGVTNSGKTTLIHHMLGLVSQKYNNTVKIGTIEDPIEFRYFDYPNIVQHQIFERRNIDRSISKMGFLDYVRSFKRADYDIVLVGEWRNEEGLSRAMLEQASAGQLIVTSLHIRESFEIYYFLEKVFNVTSDISNVIALTWNQTLLPVLCPSCRVKINKATAKTLVNNYVLAKLYDEEKRILKNLPDDIFYTKSEKGCSNCKEIGYVSRIPVYDYFVPTPYFKNHLSKGDISPYDIQQMVLKGELIGKTKVQSFGKLIESGLGEYIDIYSLKKLL